jgi:hypothetical protein
MPIYTFVNRCGFGPGQLGHLVMIAVPTRHRLGNAPTGRAASVRWMMYIVAFTGNQVINQRVNDNGTELVLNDLTVGMARQVLRARRRAMGRPGRIQRVSQRTFPP